MILIGKNICIKKVKYCIILFKILDIYIKLSLQKGGNLLVKIPTLTVLNLTKLGPWKAGSIVNNLVKVFNF